MLCNMLSKPKEVACREDLVADKTDKSTLLVAEVLPQHSVGQIVQIGQCQIAQSPSLFSLILWLFPFSPHFPHHPPHILRGISIICNTILLQMIIKPGAQGL